MNPRDNLKLAKFLEQEPSGAPRESSIRAACGRAYYAAFVVARDALLGASIKIPETGEGHGRVIALLKSSGDAGIRSAGSLLDQLREMRKNADYYLGVLNGKGGPFVKGKATTANIFANAIADEIDKMQPRDKRLGVPK